MSDRRPENRPRTKYPMTEFMKLVDCPADPPHANSCECGGYQYWTEAATLPELLAAVRRGVESGTIKGDLYDTRTGEGWHGIGKYRMSEFQGPVLVIPLEST